MPEVKKIAKKGTQLLVEQELLDRARALAVVDETSVANVWRKAINLDPQERAAATRLDELDAWLDELKEDPTAVLEWMVKNGINFDAIKGDAVRTGTMINAIRTPAA